MPQSCLCFTYLKWIKRQPNKTKQVRDQPPPSAINVTLLAFAAEHRSHSYRLISATDAHKAFSSSKPAGHLLLSNDGTDRWTNARPLHRPCSAYYEGTVKIMHYDLLPFIHYGLFSQIHFAHDSWSWIIQRCPDGKSHDYHCTGILYRPDALHNDKLMAWRHQTSIAISARCRTLQVINKCTEKNPIH